MKTFFNLLALVAIANLLILGGLVGYLIVGGRLNSESAADIAKVLRGEKLISPLPASVPTAASGPAQTATRPAEPISLDTMEMQLALLDREKRALDVDRYSRLNDAQLKLIRDRETLAQDQENFNRQAKLQEQTNQDEGFNAALTTYTKLPPKLVKDDFMKFDSEIVVRYLVKMPTRTAANVLKEFKAPAEQQKRQEIMERIRTRQLLANPTTRKAGD